MHSTGAKKPEQDQEMDQPVKFHTAFIGLGANLGDPCQQLQQALEQIRLLPNTTLIKHSSFYQTEPLVPEGIDPKTVPGYVNAICQIQTGLEAPVLLRQLHRIEQDLGRARKVRWESRVIDLDLLFYDQKIIHAENIVLPHPEIQHRLFVLEPLQEINPEWVHPVLKKTVRQMAQAIEKKNKVIKMEGTGG